MKNFYQVRDLNSKFSFQVTLVSLFMFLLSFSSMAQEQITMSLEWLSSTPTTADFQVRLTNTGNLPVQFNSIIVRGKHAENLITQGATLSWTALNNNTNSSCELSNKSTSITKSSSPLLPPPLLFLYSKNSLTFETLPNVSFFIMLPNV